MLESFNRNMEFVITVNGLTSFKQWIMIERPFDIPIMLFAAGLLCNKAIENRNTAFSDRNYKTFSILDWYIDVGIKWYSTLQPSINLKDLNCIGLC